jgi:hypothetical protein
VVARDYRACITAFIAPGLTTRAAQHATSPDPLAQPALDPHYYEDEFGQCFSLRAGLCRAAVLICSPTPDLQNMLELVKFARRLGTTSPLGDIIGAPRRSLKILMRVFNALVSEGT